MQVASRILSQNLPKIVTNCAKKMATSTRGPSSSIKEFQKVLKSSKRVLALCGAGLSAASGLDTFRGAGGMWRNYQATTLATPEAFRKDPGLVWLFYSYRRHKSLQAEPNPGHYALVELAKRMPGFITLTQNVDGEFSMGVESCD
jgi:NAD-dependent SIR2 family protein deacetylase